MVDNHSTDHTLAVLQPLIDEKKIRFIAHDANYERSKSRNTGMDHAKGDYVTFLDSDDMMGENCLSDALAFASENKCDLMFNRHAYVNMAGEPMFYFQPKINLSDPFRQMLVGNFLACIGVFISRKIYQSYRFVEDPRIIGSEDWLFWLEILHREKSIGMIDKVNSYIVDHEHRTMKIINPAGLEDRVGFIFDFLKNKLKLDEKELKIFRWSGSILIANGYYEAGMKSKSIKMVLKLILKNPLVLFNLRIMILLRNIMFR